MSLAEKRHFDDYLRDMDLKPCPACGKREGQLKRSDLGSRFPYHVKCKACGYIAFFGHRRERNVELLGISRACQR